GLRGRDDQAALALADRRDEIHHARGDRVRRGLETEPLVRVQRGELAEVDPLTGAVGRHPVDGVDLDQRGVLVLVAAALAAAVAAASPAVVLLLDVVVLALTGSLDLTGDRVALAQPRPPDLVHGHVDVAGAGEVAGGAHVGVVVADVQDAGDGHQLIALAHLAVVLLTALRVLAALVVLPAAAAALAVARAVAAAGAAAAVVVVAVAALPVAALAVVVLLAGAVRQLDGRQAPALAAPAPPVLAAAPPVPAVVAVAVI